MRAARLSAFVAIALVAGMLVPPTSSAAVSCQYLNGSRNLLVSNSNDATIGRNNVFGVGNIVVYDGANGNSTVTCGGGQATVTNTDKIIDTGQGASPNQTTVDLAGGPFAPGFTDEAGSNDEIEIELNSVEIVDFNGSEGVDNLRFGTAGANLNSQSESGGPGGFQILGTDVDVTFMGIQSLTVDGEGANDILRADGQGVLGNPFPHPTILWGREGGDTLIGGHAQDQVGFPGINMEVGNDTVRGGDSDDTLTPGPGDDQVNGGAGTDGVDYYVTPLGGAVSVGLAKAATQNTGGMGLDAIAEVENLGGSGAFNDTLLGNAGANAISGYGGNDVVNPLGGVDSVDSAGGDDQLEIRDGGPDTVVCGPQIDTVTADPAGVDTIAADCETVDFGVFGAGPGNGGAADSEVSVKLSAKEKQSVLSQGAVLVRAGCPKEDCDAILRGAIRIPQPSESSLRARVPPIRLRTVRVSLPAGVTEKLGLRLTRKGAKRTRTALDQVSPLPAVVRATVTDGDDNRDTAKARIKIVD